MNKREKDLGNGLDEEQVYKDYVKNVLPHHGWLKWPPVDVPVSQEWWTQETEVLPDFSKRPPHQLPYRSWVDCLGLPQAGKSTINRALGKLREENKSIFPIDVFDEDDLVINTPYNRFISLNLVYPPDPLLDDDIFFDVFEKDDWMSSVIYQIYKEHYWRQKLIEFSQHSTSTDPILLLGYRGPVDGITFTNALLTHKIDPNFAIPTKYLDLAQEILIPPLVGFQLLAKRIDSVIINGISQEEAQARRKSEGKETAGWVTDSPFFNDLSAWYGYFIQNVWPNLHKEYGTGLLVLDGTKSPEENLTRVVNHTQEVMKVW